MAYSEKMRQIVSLELDKTEYFNNYEFSEEDQMFLIEVPLTICDYSFDIAIMLTERIEFDIAGRIIDKIPSEYENEVEELVDIFNEYFCDDTYQYIYEKSNLFYMEKWESSVYSLREEDYNAKEDMATLRKALTISPLGTLLPLCQALRKVIDDGMNAREAFIDVMRER